MTAPLQLLSDLDDPKIQSLLHNEDPNRVLPIIGKPRKNISDLALLLSKGADEVLEQLAQQANKITQARFGNAVGLYAPLYISNKCTGNCPYCGFKKTEKMIRRTLNLTEIRLEAEALKNRGIRQVLLVAGDTPGRAGTELTIEAVKILKPLFPSVSIEVPPLLEADYRTLGDAGVDGVTLYQETYDPNLYEKLHRDGPKDDFAYRLEAMDRAGKANIRKLNIGSLWGLSPWRKEALSVGAHGAYLEKNYWRSQVLLGMPRLHNVPDDFSIAHPVSDRDFCHIIVALRIFLPDAGIVVSTREKPQFRDHLLPLGATHFSAGSSTEPGGYATPKNSGTQFAIDDERTPKEVESDLLTMGYDPVFKDWDRGFST